MQDRVDEAVPHNEKGRGEILRVDLLEDDGAIYEAAGLSCTVVLCM